MKFAIPAGFELPEGVVEGEDFETLATFRMASEGQLELVAVQGISVEEVEEAEEEESSEGQPGSMVDALRTRAYPE